MMKVVLALMGLSALMACNTVEGVAEDVKKTSQAVRRTL